MISDGYDFAIDVPVLNDWSNVGLLVTSVQNCFNAMFANVSGSRTVAMVTGELLENAIKYGDWSRIDQRLRLKVTGGVATASVRVENPAGPSDVRDLERSLEWILEFPDAEAAFRAKLLALATTTDSTVSKLGLVRIAYEGRCRIESTYDNGILSVVANIAL
jgi:hypothetical protein